MKLDKIKALFPLLNSKVTGYRSGWVEGHCPFGPWRHGGKDEHPSFAIKSSDKKKSIGKCLSCGEGGDLMDILYKIKYYQRKQPATGYNLATAMQLVADEFSDYEINPEEIPDYEEPKEKQELVFSSSWLSSFKHLPHFPEGVDYCLERGISAAMIGWLDLRFDPIQRRVGFPFRNFKGELMGIQGRAIDPKTELRYYQYRYKNHFNAHVWLGEHHLDLDQPVVLCEGPFDYASILRCYRNVAASFTTGMSVEKVKRISDAVEVITFFDYGKGGTAARQRIEEVLKGTPITHVVPDEEQDDAGAMSEIEVADALVDHVELSPFDPA